MLERKALSHFLPMAFFKFMDKLYQLHCFNFACSSTNAFKYTPAGPGIKALIQQSIVPWNEKSTPGDELNGSFLIFSIYG